MKTLAEVMAQAQESEAFNTILKEAAKNAVSQGTESTEWIQLMNFFAESPEELDELSNPHAIADTQRQVDAFRTALTYTSAGCPTVGGGFAQNAAATATKSAKQGDRNSRSGEKVKPPRKPKK